MEKGELEEFNAEAIDRPEGRQGKSKGTAGAKQLRHQGEPSRYMSTKECRSRTGTSKYQAVALPPLDIIILLRCSFRVHFGWWEEIWKLVHREG